VPNAVIPPETFLDTITPRAAYNMHARDSSADPVSEKSNRLENAREWKVSDIELARAVGTDTSEDRYREALRGHGLNRSLKRRWSTSF
jgi:hypothetical protein